MTVISRNTALDLVVLLTFAVIPFLFYGFDIIMLHQAETFIDPFDVLHRWSYLWDARTSLGGDVGYAMGGAFPMVSFFAFLSIFGLPLFIIDKMWFVFLLFISGASMYFLLSVVINKAHRLAKVAAGLAYMYSLYVIITMNGTAQFLSFYGILPAMLGIYIRSLNTRPSIKSASLLALISTVMSGINPTLVVINFLVLGAYFLFHIIFHGLKNAKDTLIFHIVAISGFIGLNLYWIYSMIRYNATAWMGPVFSEPLSMHNAASSFVEIFRSLGYWGFYSGYKGVPYFPFSTPYINNPLLIATTLLIPTIALTSILFKKQSKFPLFFAILWILCIPMAVATYPPQNPSLIGDVYLWAYENIPYFNIFRNNYKFVMPLTLACCTMLGFVIHNLWRPDSIRINFCIRLWRPISIRINFYVRKFVVLSIIVMIFINSWPLYTGNEFQDTLRIKEIPQYWYDAGNWMNSLSGDGGVFILPEQYGSIYTWGKSAGYINIPLIKRPQIFQQMGVGATSENSANLLGIVYTVFRHNSTEYLSKILGLMGVEYILQRNDVDWLYYDVQSPSQVNAILDRQIGIIYERSYGELDFYKNNYYIPRIYAADKVIYVNASINYLQTSNLLQDQNLNQSVLFFSEPFYDQNNQTLEYAHEVISILENFGNVPTYFTYWPNRGKFYEQEARGLISTLKIYVKNTNVLNDTCIQMGFSKDPQNPELFNVTVPIPKGWTGWVYANIDRVWDFDTVFIYSKGGPNVEVGLDLNPPYDCYNSDYDTLHWYNASERYYFGLEYVNTPASQLKKGDTNSTSIELEYHNINPTEYAVEVNSQKSFFLVFSESYNPQWEAYVNGEKILQHFIANGYANSWYVNRTGQFTVTLKYAPQIFYDLTKGVSFVTFMILITFSIFSSIKMKQRLRTVRSVLSKVRGLISRITPRKKGL